MPNSTEFAVRIVTCDSYIASPIPGLDVMYSNFRASEAWKVPVIRIFGSTPSGQKSCLHIHGVLPYIYVPCDDTTPGDGVAYQLAWSLDKAINTCLGQSASTRQHVFKVTIVNGIPFYGYHASEQLFFKIYFYNPMTVAKAVEILQNGGVLGKILQPHESHIPFLMQFMIDYNLHGMNLIMLKTVKFRRKDQEVKDSQSSTSVSSSLPSLKLSDSSLMSSHPIVWDINNMEEDMLLAEDISAMSYSVLEVDGVAGDILNIAGDVKSLPLNPGLELIWEDERQRRREKGMASQITPLSSQERPELPSTDSETYFELKLNAILLQQLNSSSATQDSDESPAITTKVPLCSTKELFVKSLLYDDTTTSVMDTNESDVDVSSFLSETIVDESVIDKIMSQSANQRHPLLDSQDEELLVGMLNQMDNDEVDACDNNIVDETLPSLHAAEDSILGIPQEQDKGDEEEETKEMSQKNDDLALEDEVWDNSFIPEDVKDIPQVDGMHDESVEMHDNSNIKQVNGLLFVDGANDFSDDDDTIDSSPDPLTPNVSTPKSSKYSTPKKSSKYNTPTKNSKHNTPSKLSPNTNRGKRRFTPRKRDYKQLNIVLQKSPRKLIDDTTKLQSSQTPKGEEGNSQFPRNSTPKTGSKLAASINSSKEQSPVRSTRSVTERLPTNSTDEVLPSPRLSESVTDLDTSFNCSLFNLAYLSPIRSERGSQSPPIPSSPTAVDHEVNQSPDLPNAQTRHDFKIDQFSTRNSSSQKSCASSAEEVSQSLLNDSGSTQPFSVADILVSKPRSQSMDLFSSGSSVEIIEEVRNNTKTPETGITSRNSILDDSGCKSFYNYSDSSVTLQQTIIEKDVDVIIETDKTATLPSVSSKSESMVTIMPAFKPPSRADAELWLRNLQGTDIEIHSQNNVFRMISEDSESPPAVPAIVHSTPAHSSEKSVGLLCPTVSPIVRKRNNKLTLKRTQESDNEEVTKKQGKTNRRLSFVEVLEQSEEDDLGKPFKPTLHRKLLETQIRNKYISPDLKCKSTSQLEGPSFANSFGFQGFSLHLQDVKAVTEHQYLTSMCMEVFVSTRQDLKPDPEFDAIGAIFYTILNDVPQSHDTMKNINGVIVVDASSKGNHHILSHSGVTSVPVKAVSSEVELINHFVQVIKNSDPDICIGYETELLSWGYLIQRGLHLNMNLYALLSRVRHSNEKITEEMKNRDMSEIRLSGRIVLNLWRLMRHEAALQSYTFESVAFHTLHQRYPHYTTKTLTDWWNHRTHLYRWRVVDYYMIRTCGALKMVEQLDLIGRTSEMARLYGILFYEVLSRGSQFRVESMMLRLAKPHNFVAVSPGVHQRAKMRAPETVPLIMEPESRFYEDPVLVLDFQSLYPSIIIAYNYCFSTCLGRVEHLGSSQAFDFGCTRLRVPPSLVTHLTKNKLMSISPSGVAFVHSRVRRGIIPRMLQEILDTRLMVKKGMKDHKEDKLLQRVLHARQLALKLIANVTYGYTSAHYSGRMPCVEVGDSVVSKGREALQRAISLVESNPVWKAHVVYGDTDSMFVLLKGRTKDEAFIIGDEIAAAVTKTNPKPIKLKFEKVYLPCILQTKKRYVGNMYESPSQKDPVFEAKGIETVRRDGCPASSKILEKSLKILFDSRQVVKVRSYVESQFQKILRGRVSIQDCTFAKEYRGMAGYRPTACVPALEISRKRLRIDRRSEPRASERVPYVIVYGPPGLPLIQLVKEPQELLNNTALRLNAVYYITRAIIPPMARCFGIMKVDVKSWYDELPRSIRMSVPQLSNIAQRSKTTISQYFVTLNCVVCGLTCVDGVCDSCKNQKQRSLVCISIQRRDRERRLQHLNKLCGSCEGVSSQQIMCTSLDCPVMYRRIQAERDFSENDVLRVLEEKLSF